jgi:redox-sensing transcriptional repressor
MRFSVLATSGSARRGRLELAHGIVEAAQELADRFNLNSAQVRKDLAYFGEFGVRGIGYYVAGLKAELQRILGLDREWAVALVGLGNLGSALFHYKGFSRQGFRIAVIIDDDPAKTGREVDSVPIVSTRDMARELKARSIQVAIVAVPVESAQAVTDQLVAAGIKAVLNFAPTRLRRSCGTWRRRGSRLGSGVESHLGGFLYLSLLYFGNLKIFGLGVSSSRNRSLAVSRDLG